MSLIRVSVQKTAAGFTLIELVLTIVILGFSAMILIPFFSAITHSPDPVLREKAMALGQAMMDEILAKKWDENTPNGGNPPICTSESTGVAVRSSLDSGCAFPVTGPVASAIGLDAGEAAGADHRASWNDVDDYNGVTEPVGVLFYDQDGTQLPGDLTGFTRSVAVDYIASNASPIDTSAAISKGTGAGTATDTKRIIVTVTSPLGETFSLVAVSCNF
jgi:MSHA pilin protein MshD